MKIETFERMYDDGRYYPVHRLVTEEGRTIRVRYQDFGCATVLEPLEIEDDMPEAEALESLMEYYLKLVREGYTFEISNED